MSELIHRILDDEVLKLVDQPTAKELSRGGEWLPVAYCIYQVHRLMALSDLA